MQTVVCARAFGKTAKEVLAEIGHGCDYIDDDQCPPEQRPQGVCPGWVRALAAIEPQVKLR